MKNTNFIEPIEFPRWLYSRIEDIPEIPMHGCYVTCIADDDIEEYSVLYFDRKTNNRRLMIFKHNLHYNETRVYGVY